MWSLCYIVTHVGLARHTVPGQIEHKHIEQSRTPLCPTLACQHTHAKYRSNTLPKEAIGIIGQRQALCDELS